MRPIVMTIALIMVVTAVMIEETADCHISREHLTDTTRIGGITMTEEGVTARHRFAPNLLPLQEINASTLVGTKIITVAIAKIDTMAEIDAIAKIPLVAAMLRNDAVTFSPKRAVEAGPIVDFCMTKMTENHHWTVEMNAVATFAKPKTMIDTIEAARMEKFVLQKDFAGTIMLN